MPHHHHEHARAASLRTTHEAITIDGARHAESALREPAPAEPLAPLALFLALPLAAAALVAAAH